MDSDDELPELGPLANNERANTVEYASSDEDSMPALFPVVERQPFVVSHDDAYVSSFYYSSEDDVESGWGSERDFDEEFDEDLPPLPLPFPLSHEDAEESDGEDPSYTAQLSHPRTFLTAEAWIPRPPNPDATMSLPDRISEAESDLDRAKILVAGLERVCGGFLERMLRVGGAPGAYEDVSKEDNSVSGCAICWEALLGKNTPKADHTNDVLPFAPENDEDEIVCLPCAHVFHSSCLIPWFSQKTSCPICRFNVDPYPLTRRLPTRRQDNNQQLPTSIYSAPVESEVRVSNTHDIEDIVLGFEDALSESDVESDHDHYENSAPIHTNRSWTRPEAPGRSLRENIEDKEREMGLRCWDPICMFAPTDEAPHSTTSTLRQISIKVATLTTCVHAVHPACLVRSARAAGWNAVRSNTIDVYDRDTSAAEVLCPSCFAAGTVSREDWEEGVIALAKDDP